MTSPHAISTPHGHKPWTVAATAGLGYGAWAILANHTAGTHDAVHAGFVHQSAQSSGGRPKFGRRPKLGAISVPLRSPLGAKRIVRSHVWSPKAATAPPRSWSSLKSPVSRVIRFRRPASNAPRSIETGTRLRAIAYATPPTPGLSGLSRSTGLPGR